MSRRKRAGRPPLADSAGLVWIASLRIPIALRSELERVAVSGGQTMREFRIAALRSAVEQQQTTENWKG